MKTDVKKAWLAALRSGEYKQTKKFIRKEDGFCCLGVLCDIYHKETGLGEWAIDIYNHSINFEDGSCGGVAVLTYNVKDWAGLDDQNPTLTLKDNCGSLNDDGRTFAEIADLIDAAL